MTTKLKITNIRGTVKLPQRKKHLFENNQRLETQTLKATRVGGIKLWRDTKLVSCFMAAFDCFAFLLCPFALLFSFLITFLSYLWLWGLLNYLFISYIIYIESIIYLRMCLFGCVCDICRQQWRLRILQHQHLTSYI